MIKSIEEKAMKGAGKCNLARKECHISRCQCGCSADVYARA